jgi:hypothetical protein
MEPLFLPPKKLLFLHWELKKNALNAVYLTSYNTHAEKVCQAVLVCELHELVRCNVI